MKYIEKHFKFQDANYLRELRRKGRGCFYKYLRARD